MSAFSRRPYRRSAVNVIRVSEEDDDDDNNKDKPAKQGCPWCSVALHYDQEHSCFWCVSCGWNIPQDIRENLLLLLQQQKKGEKREK
jgi:hypothetical protein